MTSCLQKTELPQQELATGRNTAALDQNSAAGLYTVENAAGVVAFGWVPEGYIAMVNDNGNPRGFGYLVDAGPDPGQIAPGTYEFTANMTWDDNSHATLVDVYVLTGSWSVGFRGGSTDPTEEGIRAVVSMTDDAALAMKVGSVFLPDGTPSTEESPVDITIPDVVVTEGSKVLMFCYFIALGGDGLRVNSMALESPGAETLAGIIQPADGATDVVRDGVVLEWKPGAFADQHDVYFGTTFDDVNDATTTVDPADAYRGNQTETTYALDRLDFGQTYYWRIDEINAPPDNTVFKGEVWSFTVEPIGYPIEDVNATASSANRFTEGPENTVNASGLDDDDLHSSESEDMWLSSAFDPNTPWIQYEFDKIRKLYQMHVWNYNSTVEPLVGFGVREATIEYSVDGIAWTTLGTTHEFARAPGESGYAADTTVDFDGVAVKYVKITANSNWGGILAQAGLSEVRFLSVPVFAREPSPDPGATDVDVNVTLSFRAGREASKHSVYLSTDEQAVIDGTALVETVTSPSYPPSLDLAGTYYWRIDEVNDAETPAIWQGDIWNLSTQEYLVVDDFESYNDIPAEEEDSSLIYLTWTDGFDNPSINGSTIGYVEAFKPSMEMDNIHGGKQSVPFIYNNTVASYSEVTVSITNLPIGENWALHGIKSLSLWFNGDPNNAAEQMYVKLNGAKVSYDGDADNTTKPAWQPWNISLADFAGVDLSNVTQLSIGFERIGLVGGAGIVLLDDIRLYPYERQLTTPVEPGIANLVGYWMFDDGSGTTATDSSGNNYHGTITGTQWVVGQVGGALSFDGVGDYVTVPPEAWSTIERQVTISFWAYGDPEGLPVDSFVFGAFQDPANNAGRVASSHLPFGNGQIFFDAGGVAPATGEYDRINKAAIPAEYEGSWQHWTFTKNVDTGEQRIYLNSVLWHSGSGLTRTMGGAGVTGFTIGCRPDLTLFYIGQIDDFRLYNRELTQDEIAWLAGRIAPFDNPF